jgi:hypothetical protein
VVAQQDHRHVAVPGPPRFALAQARTQLHAGQVTNRRAEQHEIRLRALGEVEHLPGLRRLEHLEAVALEVTAEELARVVLVLGDQESVHAADGRDAAATPPDVFSRESESDDRQLREQPSAPAGTATAGRAGSRR